MGYVAKIIIGVIVLYMLAGVLSFLFFGLGFLRNLLLFPVEIIRFYIYPVGFLPYLFLSGGIVYLIASVILQFVHKSL